MTARATAREVIDSFLDAGTWQSWDDPVVDPIDASADYRAELAAARAATGVDEAMLTGEGTCNGRRVAVARR